MERAHPKPAVILFIVICHAIALTAPFTFTWTGLISMLVLYYATIGLGITLGFHRLLAHKSYRAPRWFRLTVGVLGSLAMQAGPIRWVLTHRLHHRFADTFEDPHSPRVSFLWAHIRWNFYWEPGATSLKRHRRIARDLFADRDQRWLERSFLFLNLLAIVILFLAGLCAGGIALGLSMIVWGFFLRIVLVWHATWFVNSATHTWGHRRFDTHDDSRNLWWVSLLTFGEGWHNNHHAKPGLASHGHRWFEVDPTFWTICALEALMIVTNVKRLSSGSTGRASPSEINVIPDSDR